MIARDLLKIRTSHDPIEIAGIAAWLTDAGITFHVTDDESFFGGPTTFEVYVLSHQAERAEEVIHSNLHRPQADTHAEESLASAPIPPVEANRDYPGLKSNPYQPPGQT